MRPPWGLVWREDRTDKWAVLRAGHNWAEAELDTAVRAEIYSGFLLLLSITNLTNYNKKE